MVSKTLGALGNLFLAIFSILGALIYLAGNLLVLIVKLACFFLFLGLFAGLVYLAAFMTHTFFPALPLWLCIPVIAIIFLSIIWVEFDTAASLPDTGANRSSWLVPLAIGIILGNVWDHNGE